MSSTVKHWIAGISVIVVIITCVVLFAVFGDTTMPGEAKITQNEVYVMTGIATDDKNNKQTTSADLAPYTDYSNTQSMRFYRNYLYTSNIKFNKDKRMQVTTAGDGATSVYDFSQSGSFIELKATESVSSEFDFTKATLRLRDDILNITYSIGDSKETAQFKLLLSLENTPTVSSHDYRMSDYQLVPDQSSSRLSVLTKEMDCVARGMSDGKSNTWISFLKPANGVSKATFYNGNSALNNWNYTVSGTSVLMAEKSKTDSGQETGTTFFGRIDGNKVIFETVEKDRTEVITYEADQYNEMGSPGYDDKLNNKTLRIQSDKKGNIGSIVWNGGVMGREEYVVKKWAEEGLYVDEAYTADHVDLSVFEKYVRTHLTALTVIPETIELRTNGKADQNKITALDGILGGTTVGNRDYLSFASPDVNGLWHIYVQGNGYPTITKNNDRTQFQQVSFDFGSASAAGSTQLPTKYTMTVPTPFDEYITLSYEFILE